MGSRDDYTMEVDVLRLICIKSLKTLLQEKMGKVTITGKKV